MHAISAMDGNRKNENDQVDGRRKLGCNAAHFI
jgi:hypothetical protein